MQRLKRLWAAATHWWHEPEPEPPRPEPDLSFIRGARDYLREYDDLYQERTKIKGKDGEHDHYASQAAAIITEGNYKRSPSIESEVRVLSLTCERLVGQLEELVRTNGR